jgi:homoserine kinase
MPRPAFRAGTIHVRVPASCANLGPGFDALGLALAWHDDVVGRIGDDGLALDIAGEGDDLPRDDTHLVVRSMRTVFEHLGGQPRGIELACANRVPHGRGLGSSAAATVAGVLIGRALVVGGDTVLDDRDVLALAAEIEGHPDNVAPCLLGGLTVAWSDNGRLDAVRLDVDPVISPVVLVAPTAASTHEARNLLPERVPHADAVFNASRAALLAAALTGHRDALLAATDDRLHQPYRADAIPQSAALVATLRAAGLPAVVSGAGPSVLVLARGDAEAAAAVAHVPDGWRAEPVAVDHEGAQLVR